MNEEAARHQAQPADLTGAGASVGRRRLLKLGAGAVPVSLTLVSRPVHAFACNTTSAWGSVQINNVASVQANAESKATIVNVWTLADWVNNTAGTPGAQPWSQVGLDGANTGTWTLTDAFSHVNLGAIYPVPLTGSENFMGILMNGSEYHKYMVVAMLNSKLLNPGANDCLAPSHLDEMRRLVFAPGGATAWSEEKIVEYLQGNVVPPS